MTKKVTDYVKNGACVEFSFYFAGELWYTTDCGFKFPVPIPDIGNAVFMKRGKAILFMRYIRKHLESIEEGKSLEVV